MAKMTQSQDLRNLPDGIIADYEENRITADHNIDYDLESLNEAILLIGENPSTEVNRKFLQYFKDARNWLADT